jgi:hypothetical protein
MVVALCLLAAPGCSSSTPQPEHPEGETDQISQGEPDAKKEDEQASVKPMPAAPSGGVDQGIPDDYTIMEGDCVQLGKHFGNVTRADKVAELSPKLTAKQRQDAEQGIAEVAAKVGENWTASCSKSLVGKTGDPKAIKCALDSRTVKDFDVCLNGEQRDGK